MTYDADEPTGADASSSRAARRVATSRVSTRSTRAGLARRGRRKAPQPGRTVAKVIAASLLCLGLATGLSVVLVYNNWNGNLQFQDLSSQVKNRPEKVAVEGPREPLNILVMGSDARDCEGCKVDGESGGGLSDTTIVFHISANRKFAYAVSIPRDTLVNRPNCYRKDGSVIPALANTMWNAAYAAGGPACTQQQFEQLSGIPIDHHIVVDFGGFKDMVNALDGVEVCIPEDIDDPEHGITLKAGTREIHGEESLAYVRVRHVGDGTDPQRIKRQQAFMAAMISKAISKGMIARPDRMVGFLNAATSSLRSDFKNIAQMGDLAATFQGIGLDNISFVTTPWVYSTRQPGRVEWTPEVDELWQLMLNDRRLSEEFLSESINAGTSTDRTSTDPSGTPSGSPSGTASADASDQPSGTPTNGVTVPPTGAPTPGLSADERSKALLC